MKFCKILTILAVSLAGMLAAQAQVANRALNFGPSGAVDCGAFPALDGLDSFTVQLWINPSQWTPGSSVISRGDDFGVRLGKRGKVIFTVGNSNITAASDELKANEWNQLTLVVDRGLAKALVNNREVASATVGAIPHSGAPLIIGGGYSGLIDEVRLWNAPLEPDFERFTFNTLNKWCPQWDNLLAYYKMDQPSHPQLIDYHALESSGAVPANNGTFQGDVNRVEVENPKMPYIWNAAYTENNRFFDCIIPRDQYLLSNAIIILGADCDKETGAVFTRTPNYHATVRGGTYMAEFEGRRGVLALDGAKGTALTAPEGVMPEDTENYTFETWLWLDEWTPGACLARRETPDGQRGVSIFLGDDTERRVFVRVNGNLYGSESLSNRLPLKQWVHFGVSTGKGNEVSDAFRFYTDRAVAPTDPDVSASTVARAAAGNEGCQVIVGENLVGKLDETCFWRDFIDPAEQMDYVPMPALDRNVSPRVMHKARAYYFYDDPDWLGFSSYSQDSWLKIMQGAYDGYAGAHFYLSVAGHTRGGSPWRAILAPDAPEKRKRFAEDLAGLSGPYDGVELDLEWVDDAAGWELYSVLADEIRAVLPEGKQFRISTHNVTYDYPLDRMDEVTGFTFQQYGPNPVNFDYSNFLAKTKAFIEYGYPRDKIVTSYATTTSKGQPEGTPTTGIRWGFYEDYTPGDENVNTHEINGQTYSFIGPMQVYRRAKFTREQHLQGIFYWDMGNDYWLGTAEHPIMPRYHSAKYCSYGINANVDKIAPLP